MAAKNGASSIEKEQIFGMAEKEMEYRVDLFNRLFKLISLLSQRSASQLPRALSGLYGFPQELAQTLHYCGSLAKCWWGPNSADAAWPGYILGHATHIMALGIVLLIVTSLLSFHHFVKQITRFSSYTTWYGLDERP